MIGEFFHSMGIKTSDTRDEKGGVRYGGAANVMYEFNGARSVTRPRAQKATFKIKFLPGIDGVSQQYVSFHLKDEKESNVTALTYRYHALLRGLCNVTRR